MSECKYGDPHCPCQDGDACHYESYEGSPAVACVPTDYVRRALGRAEAENFKLAAGACVIDGGLVGDDYGNQFCTLTRKLKAVRELSEAEADVIEAAMDAAQMNEARQYGPASVQYRDALMRLWDACSDLAGEGEGTWRRP